MDELFPNAEIESRPPPVVESEHSETDEGLDRKAKGAARKGEPEKFRPTLLPAADGRDSTSEGAARILIDDSSDLELWYGLPAGLAPRVAVGSRVYVPLRNKRAVGTVVGLGSPADAGEGDFQLKPLGGLVDDAPVFTKGLLDLADWVATYYCANRDAVMRSVLPAAVRGDRHSAQSQLFASIRRKPEADEIDAISRRAPRQSSILRELIDAGEALPVTQFGAGAIKPLRGLEEKGWVQLEEKVIDRDPTADEEFVATSALELTAAQESAMAVVRKAIRAQGDSKPVLLYGVTGSGKTELYLQAIEEVVATGKSALVMVPEIALTPQTVHRFKGRFADTDTEVAVLHSHLSQGERFDEWRKIRDGRARIAVGPRSAIFAPFDDLGLIVVDEEHEPSYKQDISPRYNARDIAVVRAHLENCAVVLGSATPCLESWNNVESGKYDLARLDERIDDRELPIIRIVDMRREHRKGGGPAILSERLRSALDQRLERGEQSILFLNRRGFASSLVCPACGHVCECPHCSVSLTFHRSEDRLICHVCGFQQIGPRKCPECGDPSIRFAGYGTERAEEIFRSVYPDARIARVDADTMRRKNQLRETLDAFKRQKIDMLIGTQMIAKGLHFPNVTLVGILNADISLHVGDFRSGERTFQLLTQVAGRAGRGELKGEVIVQTHTPQSPAIQFSRHHDFIGFSEQELEFRKQFDFPPFFHAVQIMCRSSNERLAEFTLESLHKRLVPSIGESVIVGEPAPATLAKAAGQFRFQLLLRGKSARAMGRTIREVLRGMNVPDDVTVTIDVDPMAIG
ncbi:MAG: primosomal protein N' [Verrucomicrobiota bacterium]